MAHVRGEDEDHDLHKKSDTRDQQKFLRRELFEDQADHRHDRELEDRLQEVGIAEFFFRTAEISDDLDHEIVDHIVREEEADHADKKERERGICLDECGKRTVRRFFSGIFGTVSVRRRSSVLVSGCAFADRSSRFLF